MIIVVFAACGAVVQGSVGIGLALVAGPALVSIDTAFAPGPLLIAGQVVGLRHIIAERAHVDRRACRYCLRGLPVGLIAGLAVLELVSERALAVFIGMMTALAATVLLVGVQVQRTRRAEVVGGALTTFSSITAGLPGPPLVVTFHDMRPPTMRGTAAVFIMTVAAIGLAALLATGNFGGHELELTLWLLPGVTVGLVAARWVRPYLDRRWFRPTVLTIALIGGLALVIRNV